MLFRSVERAVGADQAQPGSGDALAQFRAEQLGDRLLQFKEAATSKLRVMGPAPAPIARIRNRYRYHLLVLAVDDRSLQDAAAAIGDVNVPKDVQWIVDIDPVDLQ